MRERFELGCMGFYFPGSMYEKIGFVGWIASNGSILFDTGAIYRLFSWVAGFVLVYLYPIHGVQVHLPCIRKAQAQSHDGRKKGS